MVLHRQTYVPKAKRPLEEVGERQQRHRMSSFMESSKAAAEAENTSPTKIFAFGLKNKYLQNKEVAKVGQSILQDSPLVDGHVSLDVASAVYETGKMSKRIYTDIRLLLKAAGADVLPTYDKLLAFKKERRPPVQKLANPFRGVRFDYLECLQLTSSQLLRSLALPAFRDLSEIHMTLHDGLDGSGGHSIFNQVGSDETNNIIMFMFRIENLKTVGGEVLWENPSHASSSACRPVLLMKETRENCEIVTGMQKERQGASFSVNHGNREIDVKVQAKMSMIDGKMHSCLSGLGGAFCCLCTYSKEQCKDTDLIKSGFRIDRTLEDTLQICEQEVHLEGNRKTGDYGERNINSMHPLHNLLRCFGWIFKICCHATAGHLSWSEGKLITGAIRQEYVTTCQPHVTKFEVRDQEVKLSLKLNRLLAEYDLESFLTTGVVEKVKVKCNNRANNCIRKYKTETLKKVIEATVSHYNHHHHHKHDYPTPSDTNYPGEVHLCPPKQSTRFIHRGGSSIGGFLGTGAFTTPEQSDSMLWFKYRKGMITTSNFHCVANMREKTNPANILKLLVEGNTYDIVSELLSWCRAKEVVARKLLIKTHQYRCISYKSLGMGICPTVYFLGASPDGVCMLLQGMWGVFFARDKMPLQDTEFTEYHT